MSETSTLPPSLDGKVPAHDERVVLDVAADPPPKPLTRTLAALSELSEDAVLVQVNDREPAHLFPKLEARGAAWATAEAGERVVTAIWVP